MEFQIRKFKNKDDLIVANLHRQALPKGFLSTLGEPFLACLYRLLATSKRVVVWVGADADDRCVGFVSGALDIKSCYRDVLFRGAIPLLWSVLPSLIKPAVAHRIGQTLLYPLRRGDRAADTSESPALPIAELLSIAVSDRARGAGLGRELVNALEGSLVEFGLEGPYRVVTDATDPRSNAFYKALGFDLFDTFHHHEHEMSRYTKHIVPRDEPTATEDGV